MKVVNIGILGAGVVGGGLINLIETHNEKIQLQIGYSINIKKVLVHDLSLFQAHQNKYQFTTNVDEILDDTSISIVVEVMGGVENTYPIIKKAFQNGKSVISANKDLIAKHGEELTNFAFEHKCDFYYEASVAGGIPILSTINNGLSGEIINKLTGILNGTTNYILTQMTSNNLDYSEALLLAQKNGFAEANPSSDIDGLDSARKLVILARLAHSMNVDLKDVYIRGIKDVSKNDIEMAKSLNYTIKLIGQIILVQNSKLVLTVEPTFVSNNHLLSNVDNEFNAIIINGSATNELVLTGPGAGSLPTANSVLSDLITVIKNSTNEITSKNLVMTKLNSNTLSHDSIKNKFIISLDLIDVVGSFARLSQIFANNNLSFEQINQSKSDHKDYKHVTIVLDYCSKENITEVVKLLNEVDFVDLKSYYPLLNI